MSQEKNVKVDKDDWWGYCAHSVETFPTWHRPYIAMMEVELFGAFSNYGLLTITASDLPHDVRYHQRL